MPLESYEDSFESMRTSILAHSQIYASSHNSSLHGKGLHHSQTRRGLSQPHSRKDNHARVKEVVKPRFAEFVINHYQVARYVMLVLKQVVPFEVIGSERNWRELSRSERLDLQGVLDAILLTVRDTGLVGEIH